MAAERNGPRRLGSISAADQREVFNGARAPVRPNGSSFAPHVANCRAPHVRGYHTNAPASSRARRYSPTIRPLTASERGDEMAEETTYARVGAPVTSELRFWIEARLTACTADDLPC